MRFKITTEIADLAQYLVDSSHFKFELAYPIAAKVELSDRYPDGQPPKITGSAVCVATTLGAIEDKEIASEISKALSKSLGGGWANFKGIHQERMQEVFSAIDFFYGPLWRLMQSTIAMVRWRIGAAMGATDPGRELREYLSEDGETWSQIFTARSATLRYGIPFKKTEASAALQQEIVDLVSQIGEEPLGRQLFREAWNLRFSNPRSVLVIGVAAAEVGLKKLIGALVPDAQWLVDEIQAPSLGKMLRKYLPTLPIKGGLVGKTIRPPRQLISCLEKAVELRNKVVHVGELPPGPDDLERILRAVNDFLWICDCYAGQLWAVPNISVETLSAWEDE
jgi:hypothetical protein